MIAASFPSLLQGFFTERLVRRDKPAGSRG